jgi:hypothetical protein
MNKKRGIGGSDDLSLGGWRGISLKTMYRDLRIVMMRRRLTNDGAL